MPFPHFLQHDAMDCGPTCLSIIVSFYGKRISIEKLRKLCYATREGTSLLGIGNAAEKLGFYTVGYNFPGSSYGTRRYFLVSFIGIRIILSLFIR